MIENGKGGGNTISGLRFEQKVDLHKLLSEIPGYSLKKEANRAGLTVFYRETPVARCFRKNDFYKFLEENNINWKKLYPENYYLMMLCLL